MGRAATPAGQLLQARIDAALARRWARCFPAGLSIDLRCAATIILRGHGKTVPGWKTRCYARVELGLRNEANDEYAKKYDSGDPHHVVEDGPSDAPLIASMGRELVRRLEGQCHP